LEMGNDHAAATCLEQLDHDDQPVSGQHHAAEADVIDAAKADHFSSKQVVTLSEEAGDLRRRLNHQHPRHQWQAWHMAADPKAVHRRLHVGRAGLPHGVLVEDRRQLLHLVTLWIELPDRLKIGDRIVKIQQVRINDKLVRGHGSGLDFLAFRLACLAIRRPLAVIGFFELVMRFCHVVDFRVNGRNRKGRVLLLTPAPRFGGSFQCERRILP